MQAIDYMNNCIYDKKPGTVDDLATHPKFVLIKPDGTIFYADTGNDSKKIMICGKEQTCSNHSHYLFKLLEGYFKEKVELLEKVKQNNVFAPIFEFLNDGDVIFNNTTTYEGPTFFLHGIHGQLLIPNDPTEKQIDAIKELDNYVNYFKEIEVKEYQDINKNIKETYFEEGSVAIKNYLIRHQENGKRR